MYSFGGFGTELFGTYNTILPSGLSHTVLISEGRGSPVEQPNGGKNALGEMPMSALSEGEEFLSARVQGLIIHSFFFFHLYHPLWESQEWPCPTIELRSSGANMPKTMNTSRVFALISSS